ncbi:MAG: fibronectin type III domain-containing protein [Candidatus Riflebacteria bacterium]|nr:fibronectin type III domain-containing protein [Candidatus Riflebacteria bacterium]
MQRWIASLVASALVLVLTLAPGCSGPEPGGDCLPRALTVKPGLHRALISFETAKPFAPSIEYWSASSEPATLVSTVVATSHELWLEGLKEGTAYEFRVLCPGGIVSLKRSLLTRKVVVEDLSIVRDLSSARISFKTTVPARAFLGYSAEPRSGRPAGIPQSRALQGGPAKVHQGVADQLEPDCAYTLVLSFLTEDLESARSSQLRIPSATVIIGELISTIRRFDCEAVIVRMNSLLRRRRDRKEETSAQFELERRKRRDRIQRTLEADVVALRRIAARFCPLASHLFASERVFVSEKVKVYEFLSLADHLERFCALEGIPVSTGLSGADRGSFSCGYRSSMVAPEIAPLAVPSPTLFMSGKIDFVVPDFFNKRESVDISVPVTHVATVRRAEVMLDVNGLEPELTFEARINGKVHLVFRSPVDAVGFQRRQLIYHGFDPALLLEGMNRISIALKPIPGILCQETPNLGAAQLRLERSERFRRSQ